VFGAGREETKPVGAGARGGHPDVRVGGVFDAGGEGEESVGGREEGEGRVGGSECCCAEGDLEGGRGSGGASEGGRRGRGRRVFVEAGLGPAGGDAHGQEGGNDRRGEAVQRCVDVPAVEARVVAVVGFRDGGCVEGAVVWVAQADVGQAFVRGDEAVADNLDLGLVRDGLQVRVEDGPLGVEGCAVAVRGRRGIEPVGELELRLWRDVELVLEDDDLVGEQGGADHVEVGVWTSVSMTGMEGVRVDSLLRRLPIQRVVSQSVYSMQCHLATWFLMSLLYLTCEILDVDT
jgi:hypothetical protein